MNITTTVTDALQKLEALGSPAQIRDYFVHEEIHGIRQSGSTCPVRRYLDRELEYPSNFWMQVRTYSTAWMHDTVHVEVRHPPLVRTFIENFDRGDYRELESTL